MQETKKCIACAEEILADALLCKHCGTRQDDGTFATNQGSNGVDANPSLVAPETKRRPKGVLVLIIILVLASIGVGGYAGVYLPAQEQAAAQLEEQEAEEAAQKKADEEAEIQAARDEMIRKNEVEARYDTIMNIQTSVGELASEHLKDGLIDGKLLGITCTPISGFQVENLAQSSTTFECFVATEDNDDGTQSGYTYSATMNWLEGSYTYRLGRD